MRLRHLLGIVAACVIGVSILTATSATAVQVSATPQIGAPPAQVAAPRVASGAYVPLTTVAPATTTAPQTTVVPQGTTEAVAPCPSTVAAVNGPLPRLGSTLLRDLSAYAKNAPVHASISDWYDSGGSFGGGVPAAAVRAVMRQGLANGLDEGQVRSFLNPSFLRGMNDPRGGAWLFRFVAMRHDPVFYGQLAAYAQGVAGLSSGPMTAQADVFEAFPLLQAAYMAQAGAIPPDQGTASLMVQLGNQGYAPAQRAIDAIIASGNHPVAGAQNAGGVGSHMLAYIYDYLVVNYHGPLSRDARQAVANRGAYMSWAERIAAWEVTGLHIEDAPTPATFPASVGSVPSIGAC